MKTIRVEFDEAILERFDRHPAVRERGRSAVLQEAVGAYLTEADSDDVTERYRTGYRSAPGIDDELEGWADQAVWPED
ncbi:MAG: hypothetical protein OXK79_09990 [Chloroflexota bacterium]|nr:hypothetical protein [Chloroflexota bacterium]